MAIRLDWIPYGGGNSAGQEIIRLDTGIINSVGPTVNTFTDTSVQPNTLYEYQVQNLCYVGGPVASNPVIGISWECPRINITEKAGSFSVDLDEIEYGFYLSLDLYDVANETLVAPGDPFPPEKGPISQVFSGLQPGTYYTVRVIIVAQDFQGEPDQTFTYTYECTEQGYIGALASCPTASNVTANPQY
jgi:hypothetical protein